MELKQLQNVRQDPIHHPEGDAYVHTMIVLDRISTSDNRKLEMLVAALFHDLGKITMSTEDPETCLDGWRIPNSGVRIVKVYSCRALLNAPISKQQQAVRECTCLHQLHEALPIPL